MSKVAKVEMFETSDGAVFDSYAAALTHQNTLDAEEPLRRFIEASGKQRAQITLAENTIRAWERFRATGELPTPPARRSTRAQA